MGNRTSTYFGGGGVYNNVVYAAEWELAKQRGDVRLHGDDVWRETKRVMKSKRVRSLLMHNGITIRFEHSPGKGGGWYRGGGLITLAHSKSSGLAPHVIVHELAHNGASKVHVEPRFRKAASGAHGPRFTTALLRLYRAAYGREHSQALNDALAERGARAVDVNGEVSRLRAGTWSV